MRGRIVPADELRRERAERQAGEPGSSSGPSWL
jgi:hypothetical protein